MDVFSEQGDWIAYLENSGVSKFLGYDRVYLHTMVMVMIMIMIMARAEARTMKFLIPT